MGGTARGQGGWGDGEGRVLLVGWQEVWGDARAMERWRVLHRLQELYDVMRKVPRQLHCLCQAATCEPPHYERVTQITPG